MLLHYALVLYFVLYWYTQWLHEQYTCLTSFFFQFCNYIRLSDFQPKQAAVEQMLIYFHLYYFIFLYIFFTFKTWWYAALCLHWTVQLYLFMPTPNQVNKRIKLIKSLYAVPLHSSCELTQVLNAYKWDEKCLYPKQPRERQTKQV